MLLNYCRKLGTARVYLGGTLRTVTVITPIETSILSQDGVKALVAYGSVGMNRLAEKVAKPQLYQQQKLNPEGKPLRKIATMNVAEMIAEESVLEESHLRVT